MLQRFQRIRETDMKHLLLSLTLILSANAWAEDELPKYLYCEFGKVSAEFHFNDEGENWFIVKGGDKAFEKKTIIKKLKVSKDSISFVERQHFSTGQTQVYINRITGGIFFPNPTYGSGECSTSKPNNERKF